MSTFSGNFKQLFINESKGGPRGGGGRHHREPRRQPGEDRERPREGARAQGAGQRSRQDHHADGQAQLVAAAGSNSPEVLETGVFFQKYILIWDFVI